jgi:hypothetical protein
MQTLWDAVDHYNKGDRLKDPWLDHDSNGKLIAYSFSVRFGTGAITLLCVLLEENLTRLRF